MPYQNAWASDVLLDSGCEHTDLIYASLLTYGITAMLVAHVW